MRIAFLLHWNETQTSGVFKKVCAQVEDWTSMGAIVSLHLVTRRYCLEDWRQALKDVHLTEHRYSRLQRWEAFQKAGVEIKRTSPDLVYHRFDLFMPSISKMARRIPVVLEINTNDVAEYRSGGVLRYAYHLLTRSLLLHAAAGLVFVTHELARSKLFRARNRPRIVIPNGIKLHNIAPFPPACSEIPWLVFVGTPHQPWHGVDKIVHLAALIPDIQIHCIGPASFGHSVLPPNLHFHGRLSASEYLEYMSASVAGLGPLALHRKSMHESCPLKVREYLAYGLPVILAGKDSDFPDGAPFILSLPNEENNIAPAVQQVKHFVQKWKSTRVPRQDVLNLDHELKERHRLRFFEHVAIGKCKTESH